MGAIRRNCVLILFMMQPVSLLHASDDIELVEYMQLAQYFAHKTNLAIQHKNQALAKFYAHEMEEVIEKIEDVPSYDDFPIGALTKKLIVPAFEKFEKSLNSDASSSAVEKSFDAVINACNACHLATEHGYVHIIKNNNNPYMQSFAPQE